jgi:hypothetical protein
VTLDELRAEAVWLKQCYGGSCPWPIETANDLTEFASNILFDEPDHVTVGELRRIKQLIDRLKPKSTKELTRESKSPAPRREKNMAATLDEIMSLPTNLMSLTIGKAKKEKYRAWQTAGAHARVEKGKRKDIISHWKELSLMSPRKRASTVAGKLGVSKHWVRKVIRDEKKRINQF